MEQNEIVVHSWSEVCERLYDDAWKPELGRFRSDYAFRGMGDRSYALRNSFTRVCRDNPHLEYHLLRNFKKYGQFDDPSMVSSDWRLMTLAQHHGLPNRLMDWTYSPFVALHFATDDPSKYGRDGVIWQVDYVQVNRMLPEPLRGVMEKVGANAFTVEMIEEAVPTLLDFDAYHNQNHDLVIFFEPPSLDYRIINQFAFFSVMSTATGRLDGWLYKYPQLYRKIIIPKELKWEIRDKLDQANITERILFPGLDGLAKWLLRHYTPRCLEDRDEN